MTYKGTVDAGLMDFVWSKNAATTAKQPSRHLFRITKEAWDACTWDEVNATCEALREAGLYSLPYDAVDIEIPVDQVVNWTSSKADDEALGLGLMSVIKDGKTFIQSHLGPSVVMRFTGVSTVPERPIQVFIVDYKSRKQFAAPVPGKEDVSRHTDPALNEQDRLAFSNLLIALLATRNARKETKVHKLAKLGIGKKRLDAQYEYTTTISPPAAAEELPDDEEHPPTGRTVCPHLRRAHVKGVRFGPKHQFLKSKLIHATFVNADKEWTKTRVAYNVSL